MVQEQVHVNLRTMLVVLIVMVVGGVYGLGALANGDWLWLVPYFNETPQRIAIHRAGCTVEIVEGEAGFAELTRALNEALPQYEAYNDAYGLSTESLEEFRTKQESIEVFYPRPIKIHTPYHLGDPDSLFIPLSGHFAEDNSVFGGHAGVYWSGALRLKSIANIQQAARAVACPQ